MKKLVLVGLMLSLSIGCGRGWMPCLSRGASCGNGSCLGAAPALPQGCTTCGGANAAGYGGYDGGDYYGGETIVGDSYGGGQAVPFGSGAIVAPSMQNLPGPIRPAS